VEKTHADRCRYPAPIGGRAEEIRQIALGDRNALAVKHLEQICRAVLNGDDIVAEKLASAIVERYGF
jgi:hypothetical protein